MQTKGRQFFFWCCKWTSSKAFSNAKAKSKTKSYHLMIIHETNDNRMKNAFFVIFFIYFFLGFKWNSNQTTFNQGEKTTNINNKLNFLKTIIGYTHNFLFIFWFWFFFVDLHHSYPHIKNGNEVKHMHTHTRDVNTKKNEIDFDYE